MPLPFLNKKTQPMAGIILQRRTPDEPDSVEPKDQTGSEAIEACAQDLIDAVHMKDTKRVAEALESAFTILEGMPDEEPQYSDEK